MKSVPAKNPPNPWHSRHVEYLGQPPEQPLEIYEDHTRSILAENDSPDIGFRWSLNPYRGCQHACAYCLDGDTEILLADGRVRRISELRIGDEVHGTERVGHYRCYVRSRVLDHWSVLKPAYRIELADGTVLVASADHRFLTDRGWKHVIGAEQGRARRPHLTANQALLGTGAFATPPMITDEYRMGYLCGLIRGDGLVGTYDYSGRRRDREVQHQFRLALSDFEALDRASEYLVALGITTQRRVFANASGVKPMQAIRTHAREQVDRIRALIQSPQLATSDWRRGFLAGIFDAEGSHSRGIVRISNNDPSILRVTTECLSELGFDAVLEARRPVPMIRVRGGMREHLRFFHTTDPAISRKRTLLGRRLKNDARLEVTSILPLGETRRLFDITTTTGDFIANGVVSHNCYARPSHEYLGFGAGTDFDRKIATKPRAPELLREAFEKRSWSGELVMFSGNTDCYQPLEASYELTRRCLQVCAEYRNPVHVITKAALVERDIDVISELVQTTSYAGVSVSIPFWDARHARLIEPHAPTPERRMRAVERLSQAGIPVTVNVAPVIPGLSDPDIPKILEAAAAAGAKSAALILLRLPGPVKQVFAERLRATLPLRAEKVLARAREIRGGKLNDPRFGERFRGQGEYYETIRALFENTARRLGLLRRDYDHYADDGDAAPTSFRRPTDRGGQLRLFE